MRRKNEMKKSAKPWPESEVIPLLESKVIPLPEAAVIPLPKIELFSLKMGFSSTL